MWWALSRYTAEKRKIKASTRELYGKVNGGERLLLVILLVAALIAGAALGAVAVAEDAPVIATMYVKPDVRPHLNGRAEASKKSEIEARFYSGDALEVVEIGAEWSRVRGGECGTVWVNNDYITPEAPAGEPTRYIVTGNGRVKVRDVPEQSGSRVRFAEVGETVDVYSWVGNWAVVDGGYIDGEFLAEGESK